jgi:hypothetical protein
LGLSSLAAGASGGLSLLAQAVLEFGKRISSWLKVKLKLNTQKIGEYLGAGAIGLAMLAPLSGAAAVGAVAAGVGAFAMGGTGAFSGAVGAIGSFIGAILAATISIIVAPIVISLIVIPIFLAITIFIITSGGYIVPPGDSFVSSEGLGGDYPKCWPLNDSSGPFVKQEHILIAQTLMLLI